MIFGPVSRIQRSKKPRIPDFGPTTRLIFIIFFISLCSGLEVLVPEHHEPVVLQPNGIAARGKESLLVFFLQPQSGVHLCAHQHHLSHHR
jgi:hypothetical protein